MRAFSITLILSSATVLTSCAGLWPRAGGQEDRASAYRNWEKCGGGWDNIHYSALNQITRENVGQLKVAWRFSTGDAFPGSEMQCNPIVIDGVLYATTPKLRVIALDGATGMARWIFDPNDPKSEPRPARNRGLTYWSEGTDKRIFFGYKHFMYALDATTGEPVSSFGEGGKIDLREGLGRDPKKISLGMTSPPSVYEDFLITGFLTSEALPAAPGHIRAFDVRTGKQRWIFHTIPQPGEFGYKTWPPDAWQYTGGANNWCGLTVDPRAGRVYVPTGSASFDFYGSNRFGDDLFANTLLCLKATTGKRIWHFQTVKHDLWDRDLPTAPSLVTLHRGGRDIDAVIQPTKSGFLFAFDRKKGKPIFPIEERKVPTKGALGEWFSETQPLPLAPPPFARQKLTEDLLTNRTPEAHAAVLEKLRKLHSTGQFEPPSVEGTIVFPGFDGGAEWGGAAFDPESGLMYVNANEMAWILRLVEKPKHPVRTTGKELYQGLCASCHKTDLSGTPPEFPSLIKITSKMTDDEMKSRMVNGQGRMPGLPSLDDNGASAIIRYVTKGEDIATTTTGITPSPMDQIYTTDGYNKFLDPEGYPGVAPPWGTISAIDLNRGEIAWQIPFGEYPELAAKGMKNTGSENYGGSVVTAGGLLFIGATDFDKKFHAFDKTTGKLLWETTLPAGGNATPATYEVNGRQYVVIGAGGGKWGAPSGDSYVAFALPESKTGGRIGDIPSNQ